MILSNISKNNIPNINPIVAGSHEIIYHKHKNINYDVMTNITIDIIKNLFKK